MGFHSVDTDIHLNDCLVHGNLHWGNNFVFFTIIIIIATTACSTILLTWSWMLDHLGELHVHPLALEYLDLHASKYQLSDLLCNINILEYSLLNCSVLYTFTLA